MKILFMGTPDFARGVLETLYNDKAHEIVAVVTQPDKPKGRSDKMIASPVKEFAIAHGIDVLQPVKIKTEEAVEELRGYDADIFVVAAFGQILSKEILDMPKFGCVNVHASLLPKYRGAAPIQWSIADGHKETGVTIMQMNEGMDTGDIITQVTVPISSVDTGESLFDKLMAAGAKLLVETLELIENGKATRTPQNEEEATYAKMLKKEMGLINFTQGAEQIENTIRAFTPWPGGYTYLNGKMLKIKKCRIVEGVQETMKTGEATCGQIINITKNEIYVACGEGVLCIDELQLEGKKAMSAHDFLLGNQIDTSIVLGTDI